MQIFIKYGPGEFYEKSSTYFSSGYNLSDTSITDTPLEFLYASPAYMIFLLPHAKT
jgi:hypothetical protein